MNRCIDISRVQNLIIAKIAQMRKYIKGKDKAEQNQEIEVCKRAGISTERIEAMSAYCKEHGISYKNLTPNQILILEMACKKDSHDNETYHDNWSEYNEAYDDYNDCHGDYYDAE